MSETFKIVVTSCLTIFGGIFIYCAGKIIEEWFIKPINDQYDCFGDIRYILIYNAPYYSSPDPRLKDLEEVRKETRGVASDLYSATQVIRCYGLLARMKVVLQKKDIDIIASSLIGLSNCLDDTRYREQNEKRIRKINNIIGTVKIEDESEI
jgi:hypothetical protein